MKKIIAILLFVNLFAYNCIVFQKGLNDEYILIDLSKSIISYNKEDKILKNKWL